MKTEQEEFWSGAFGDDYIGRNESEGLLASNISLFSKIIESTGPISSILEMGCNIGMNLRALRRLLPDCELAGVEINQTAAEVLREWGEAQVFTDSILEVELEQKFDLTFTKGVLIHINPDYLNQVYRRLYEYSKKYICVAEYYNPTPVELSYRGHSGRLFKRDFAGEMLGLYQDLELVDYGFVYHKDPVFPQDDISWFVLKKS